ncbi:MAG: flagellar hook-length control protein FliK [Xanthobacteraceae bacterium]|nr:flagellar hook-length control protein FliK [Xanthobacteraceae bacterium]
MVTAINPITPVIAAESVGPDVVLQPGSVIDARVLRILANDLVRIAVSSLSIEVASEVPLQAGQALQLAVTQTPDGIRLQIVPQQAEDLLQTPATNIANSISSAALPSAQTTITQPLTPLEAAAVAHALQTAAATQGGGLSPLFANLAATATSNQLPANVQGAASALLALRLPLNTQLSGQDIAAAFRQSGLFFEQSQTAQAGGAPDLKAALIVLRQTLNSWLGEAFPDGGASDGGQPAGQFAQQGQVRAQAELNASAAPPLAPDISLEEIFLPGAVVPVAEDVEDLGVLLNGSLSSSRSSRPGNPSSLQEILQAFPKGVQDAVASLLADENKELPPPFRGAAPSAQAIASATVDEHTSSKVIAHRLLSDTDAALSRQTLLQIASLPDQSSQVRADLTHRWNFEIPFVTPQGTAVAQFEISRDGGNARDAETPDRVWRARFSLNLEPAGPVHAQISLSGERTSVRMWAERSETASRLRADLPKLSQALREAELTPGDIVVGNGSPPSPAPQSGHFLDRAL